MENISTFGSDVFSGSGGMPHGEPVPATLASSRSGLKRSFSLLCFLHRFLALTMHSIFSAGTSRWIARATASAVNCGGEKRQCEQPEQQQQQQRQEQEQQQQQQARRAEAASSAPAAPTSPAHSAACEGSTARINLNGTHPPAQLQSAEGGIQINMRSSPAAPCRSPPATAGATPC